MSTTPTRFSIRLREQRQITSKAASSTQSEKGSTKSQPPESSSSKVKRRKVDHETEGASNSKNKAISKLDLRTKGCEGYLKQMTEIPMDVLYVIFSFLRPIDLLYFSWTNKSLHYIIMGKSGRFLWKNVRVRRASSALLISQ